MKWELIKCLVSFVPSYRMGILMETTEVNLGTSSYRGRRAQPELFGAMGTPSDLFADTVHTIAINTMETEFGSIVEPIPITLKTYKQLQARGHPSMGTNGYSYPQQMVTALTPVPHYGPYAHEVQRPSTSSHTPSPVKEETKDDQKITRPPKKKWIKEYLGESFCCQRGRTCYVI